MTEKRAKKGRTVAKTDKTVSANDFRKVPVENAGITQSTKHLSGRRRRTGPVTEKVFYETQDRVTGDDLVAFRMRHELSVHQMSDLFGVGFKGMTYELNRGSHGVESRVVCYLYRLYFKHPELLAQDVSIKGFYDSVGGEDTCSGTIFSLILGMELSAYARYFSKGKPPKALVKIITHTLRLAENDPPAAFAMIRQLAEVEGDSRGFNAINERTWYPDGTIVEYGTANKN